jgi:hypothetical protein
MSLEKLLSRAHPTSFDRSIDRQWNIQNAYLLIKDAFYILNLVENDKQKKYTQLYEFLDRKETYLELLKELDELVDKYKLRNWIKDRERHYDFLGDSLEPTDTFYDKDDLDQVVCHYHDTLIHADKLVARDITWKHINYDYSDDESIVSE